MLKDTTITKRQLDLAMRMMLEQVSRLSDGDYEQSLVVQLFLDCVDRTLFHGQAVMVHEPWWALRQSEAELADVLSSAFDSRILHQTVQSGERRSVETHVSCQP